MAVNLSTCPVVDNDQELFYPLNKSLSLFFHGVLFTCSRIWGFNCGVILQISDKVFREDSQYPRL